MDWVMANGLVVSGDLVVVRVSYIYADKICL